jgi:hypothetical protein
MKCLCIDAVLEGIQNRVDNESIWNASNWIVVVSNCKMINPFQTNLEEAINHTTIELKSKFTSISC